MPENITLCDLCDRPISLFSRYNLTIERPNTDQHDRYTLCRECLLNEAIGYIATTIEKKTAQADTLANTP
jgi:hypothetical protein